MMRYDDPTLQDKLAAEYVLGTLHGRARNRFESLMTTRPALRAQVAQWARRLEPLAETMPPQPPPPQLWTAIQQRLQLTSPPTDTRAQRSGPQSWLAVAATLLLAVAIGFMVPRFVSQQPERLVMVTDEASQPMWVISAMEKQEMVKVKTMKPAGVGPGKVCVLWLMWEDGTIASLGALSEEQGERMHKLPKGVANRSLASAQVAITIEPKGPDYPTMSPETIFRGDWVEL